MFKIHFFCTVAVVFNEEPRRLCGKFTNAYGSAIRHGEDLKTSVSGAAMAWRSFSHFILSI